MRTLFFSMHGVSTALSSSAMGCHLFLIDTAAAERPLLPQASAKHRKHTSGNFRFFLSCYKTSGWTEEKMER